MDPTLRALIQNYRFDGHYISKRYCQRRSRVDRTNVLFTRTSILILLILLHRTI